MSDIPHPRTHDLARENHGITEDVGPELESGLESGDDLDTGAIVGGAADDEERPDDEEPDDGAGAEAP